MLQMHERTIDLIGTHAAIFENEDGTSGIEFPGSAEGGLQQA